MPNKPLNLYAVTLITKEAQFSKAARTENGFAGQNTFFRVARSLDEVKGLVEPMLEPDVNVRAVIYDLADPAALVRLSKSSVAERPRVVINRDGSYA